MKNSRADDIEATPYLIEFLYERYFGKQSASVEWHDQKKERLAARSDWKDRVNAVYFPKLQRLPKAMSALKRSRDLYRAILSGSVRELLPYQSRYKFIAVVGAPRSGGSYLTKALFSALGYEVGRVSASIAHDGFPELAPFFLAEGYNVHTIMASRMAEYLVMVDLFFGDSKPLNSRVIVPKKASKAAYQGAFFNTSLGEATEYIVTVRHPIPSCISTYEKSGGLPAGGRFATRSAIEVWAARDYLFLAGDSEAQHLTNLDYFDVYLRFWEQYHYSLVLSGLSANKKWTVVPYTESAMVATADDIFRRFGSEEGVERFETTDKRQRHPEWAVRAEKAIGRVRDVWATVGLSFPVESLMESW